MDKEIWDDLLKYLLLNKGKIIGGMVGLIFALLILLIGILKTLIIVIFTIAGFYIGSRWDIEKDMIKILDRIIPNKFK